MADLNVYKHGWATNFTSADATGCEEVKAAPSAGTSLYLNGVIMSTDGAITLTLGAGETGGAVTAALVGPITFTANQTIALKFDRPIKVGDATSLTVDAGGVAAVTVYAEGFTT